MRKLLASAASPGAKWFGVWIARTIAPLVPCVGLLSQIPDGDYVVSAYDSILLPGLGGIYVVHPRVMGPAQRITGLGPDLTGSFSSGMGAYCVSVRQSDGALYVGEVTDDGDELDLHVITLRGLAVATDTKISLGPVTAGDITHVEELPSGDLLIAANVPPQPPLNGVRWVS